MECTEDSFCWTYSIPELPPPPPLPSFLSAEVNGFLNQTKGQSGSGFGDCSLCSWAGADAAYDEAKGSPPLPLSSLLVIVAVVSALAGAGLTGGILSFRKLRNRKLQGSVDSMRHLARKINETSRPTTSMPPFPANTLSSENNYCEGPYFDKDASNNIYAELHPGMPAGNGLWARPPLPAPPPVQNCYLELKDLPSQCRRCLPPVPPTWQSATAQVSPPHSAYYSDLDPTQRPSQPI